MNILITGGLGYVGGGLSKYLLNNRYQVIIGTSRKDLKIPNQLKKCSLVYNNFDSISNLADICNGVDCVIHLAALNSQKCQNSPELAIKINGIGTYNLIQACIKKKVKYFLYFSTAHVYSSPLVGQLDEDTLPKPSSTYAISHRLAEDFLLDSIYNQHINGAIFRLSNSIGLPLIKEANDWTLFINDSCKKAVVEKVIVINSNPNIQRDFISIHNVFKISEYFLSAQPTPDYPIFNVGSGTSYSLLNIAVIIADRCEQLFSFRPNIIFSANNHHENIELNYNVSKLTSQIGYRINNILNPLIDEILFFCKEEFC